MITTIPTSIVREIHQLAMNGAVLQLIEITTSDGEVLRLVRNTEAITWNGHEWSYTIPFSIEAVDESTSGESTELFVYVSNYGGIMEELLLQYNSFVGATCVIYLVDSYCLSETEPLFSRSFKVAKPVCDHQAVGLKLCADNSYLQAFPSWKFHGTLCQYPDFKGDRCGYTGAATSCDRTISACAALSNITRFGGAMSMYGEIIDV